MLHDCGWMRDSWQCAGSHTKDKTPPSLRVTKSVTKYEPAQGSVEVRREYTRDTECVTVTDSAGVQLSHTDRTVGRPREYATPADRQKAYRASKKAAK